MNRNNRARPRCSHGCALGILVQPSAHLIAVATAQAPPAPPATTAKPRRHRQATDNAAAAAPKPPLAAARRTAAGRRRLAAALRPRRAAAASSSTSRRSRAGTSRRTWSRSAPCRYRDKAGDKPALGTVKLEADTKVAVADRLVSFQNMKITEANFQTLPKEQVREIVAAIETGDSRRRTGDRARSRPRQRRQEPDRAEERRRHQGRSADDLLQQDARR